MNHYEILEVKSDSSQSEIKAAYRKLVKRYHPDINPDPSAAQQMIKINEAYEILSNSTSRNLYDLYLQGVPVKTEIHQASPDQQYRESYKAKKAKEEQERIIFLVKIKSRFYKYQRHACLLFFAIGFLFTVDYYFQFTQKVEEIVEIGQTRFQTGVVTQEGTRLTTSRALYDDYYRENANSVKVKYSFLFNKPAKIQVVNVGVDYPVNDTIYVFRNVFSIIILIFSSIVLKNKEYSDFRLSCGLVPVFLILFLLIFGISEMN